jgi:FtsP/CotA-like multicopper oxidase with cupredoxin domain
VRRTGAADPGPRKDTVIVRPAERVTVDFDAANPGRRNRQILWIPVLA